MYTMCIHITTLLLHTCPTGPSRNLALPMTSNAAAWDSKTWESPPHRKIKVPVSAGACRVYICSRCVSDSSYSTSVVIIVLYSVVHT